MRMLLKHFAILGVIAGSALSVLPHTASGADKPDFASLDLQELMNEPLIVSTTRRDEDVRSVPLSIVALGGPQLEANGVTHLTELGKLSANVGNIDEYSRSSARWFIRGVGSTQYYSNANSKVAIYQDDTYLNSIVVQNVSLFDIERVEIARGPQGTLFGQNSTAGLIHVITRRPSLDDGSNGYLQTSAGSFDALHAEGAMGFGIGERMAARVSFIRETRAGTRDVLVGNATLDPQTTFVRERRGETDFGAARAQLFAQATDNVSVLLNVHMGEDRGQPAPTKPVGAVDYTQPMEDGRPSACATPHIGHPTCSDLTGYADTSPAYEGMYTASNDTHFMHMHSSGSALSVNWDAPTFLLTSISAYERNSTRIQDEIDGSPFDVLSLHMRTRAQQVSQEVRVASADDRVIRWLGGVYAYRDELESDSALPTRGLGAGALVGGPTLEGVGSIGYQKTQSYAAFSQVDYKVLPRLRLTIGARLTRETKQLEYAAYIVDVTSSTPAIFLDRDYVLEHMLMQTIDFPAEHTWQDLSSRVALDYQLGENVMAYASYSRGFNSGAFNGGAYLPGEASLVDPESIASTELGIKASLPERGVRVEATLWHYDFKDQQVFSLVTQPDGLPTNQLANAARSTLYGAELEIGWNVTERLALETSLGNIHSRYDRFDGSIAGDLSGNALPYAPEYTFAGRVQYTWPLQFGTLVAQTNAHYASKQYFTPDNRPLLMQRAHWLADARLTFTTRDERWSASVWTDNLTDQEYLRVATDIAGLGLYQLQYGDPRTYGLTVGYQFGGK